MAWRDDDKKQPLLNYGDENIDPFSFFYTLAQRSQDSKEAESGYIRALTKQFGMEADILRLNSMNRKMRFIFPDAVVQRAQRAVSRQGRQGNPKLLWNLFRGAVRGLDSVDSRGFRWRTQDIDNDW